MTNKLEKQKMLAEICMECGSIFGKDKTTMTDKQNFEKDINVLSKQKIMYDYNAKDCEQCSSDSVCCYCKNIACYKLEEQLKAKEQECEELKKTLIEIKEIAEILAPKTDEYENCLDRDRCFECDFTEDCTYFNIKQILQKISEVENE